MSSVNTKLELELELEFVSSSATMVWYVMYTFCHWYKDAGTHC